MGSWDSEFKTQANQLTAAGEIGGSGPSAQTGAGAEGATAPETLRHTDRSGMGLWKAGVGAGKAMVRPFMTPPKMKTGPRAQPAFGPKRRPISR